MKNYFVFAIKKIYLLKFSAWVSVAAYCDDLNKKNNLIFI